MQAWRNRFSFVALHLLIYLLVRFFILFFLFFDLQANILCCLFTLQQEYFTEKKMEASYLHFIIYFCFLFTIFLFLSLIFLDIILHINHWENLLGSFQCLVCVKMTIGGSGGL